MSEHHHEPHGDVDEEGGADRLAAGETPGEDPRVAAAVERLDGLGDQPPAEHVEVYEDVHHVLQESLAEAAGERQNP